MSELTLDMRVKGLIKMLLQTDNYIAVDIVRDLQNRITALEQKQITLQHNSTLLKSCEQALDDRDIKIETLEQQLKTAKVLPDKLDYTCRPFACHPDYCRGYNQAIDDIANNLEGK